MKLFGFNIERVKELRPVGPRPPNYGVNAEFITGGWQRNLVPPMTDSVLAFSAVYSCISLISNDIAKLRLKLSRRQDDETWEEVKHSQYLSVLRKPNHFETRAQFVRNWIVQKLVHGNSYSLKRRQDLRGMVTGLTCSTRRRPRRSSLKTGMCSTASVATGLPRCARTIVLFRRPKSFMTGCWLFGIR